MACKVSAKKSAVLWGSPYMERIAFSCYIWNCVNLFKFWQFDYNVYWCGSLWIHLNNFLWDSWIWMFISFPRFENFLPLFLWMGFCPFSLSVFLLGVHDVYSVPLIVFYKSLKQSSLYFFLLSPLFVPLIEWFPLTYLHVC